LSSVRGEVITSEAAEEYDGQGEETDEVHRDGRRADADAGGVTSPFDEALITQGDSLEEVFEMARDAAATLKAGRAELAREPAKKGA
jgi:hypothetical protein